MNKTKNRRWVRSVAFIGILLFAAVITVNYIIDPLQFYRKAFYSPIFEKQMRYQLPELAKNYDYNTIVLGSSMAENHVPSYIDKKMGFKTLKLAMSAGLPKEQNMLAKVAFDTGKVKNVIWCIDYFAIREPAGRVREDQGPFPYYLYDHNALNDIKYLFNIDSTIDSAKIVGNKLLNRALNRNSIPESLDLLYTWTDPKIFIFNRERVLKNWNARETYAATIDQRTEMNNITTNLSDNVIMFVREHPEVNFYFYHPPYSILQHIFYYNANKQLFDNELFAKKYLFQQIGGLPNVKIDDFQHEDKITFNLNNYKDIAHHSMKINEFVIDSIAKDEYRVTAGNLEPHLLKLRDQVESFDLSKL